MIATLKCCCNLTKEDLLELHRIGAVLLINGRCQNPRAIFPPIALETKETADGQSSSQATTVQFTTESSGLDSDICGMPLGAHPSNFPAGEFSVHLCIIQELIVGMIYSGTDHRA